MRFIADSIEFSVFFITCQTKVTMEFSEHDKFWCHSLLKVLILIMRTYVSAVRHCICQMTNIKTDAKHTKAINSERPTMKSASTGHLFPLNIPWWGRFWWNTGWYWSLINFDSVECVFFVLIWACLQWSHTNFKRKIDESLNENRISKSKDIYIVQMENQFLNDSIYRIWFSVVSFMCVNKSIWKFNADVNKAIMWCNWTNWHQEKMKMIMLS